VIVPYALPIVFMVAGTQEQLKTPPPPPIVKEEVIEDSNKQVNLDEIVMVGYKAETPNDSEVPYAVIENVPVFQGCEHLTSNDEKKKCTSDKITEFVSGNFNRKIAKKNGLKGRQRMTVLFKIDKEGSITGVQSRAPHPSLEAEAIRVVKLLPKMIPGKQRGINVTVPYSLPIVFVAE